MQDKKSFPISYFLIDAGIKWIVENQDTALVVIDAKFPDIVLPSSILKEEEKQESSALMYLDLSPDLISNYSFDKETMSFDSVLNGERTHVILPVYSIKMLKGKNNSVGIDIPSISAEEYLENRDFYRPSLHNVDERLKASAGGHIPNISKNTNSKIPNLRLVK